MFHIKPSLDFRKDKGQLIPHSRRQDSPSSQSQTNSTYNLLQVNPYWQVGYCQGTAFIVGLLLMQMPEEESFAVLVKMMKDYGMREMFKPSMTELGLCMYQLDTLIEQHMPDLHVHFQVKFNSILNCCEFNN